MIYKRELHIFNKCRIANSLDADMQPASYAEYEEEDLHKPLIKNIDSLGHDSSPYGYILDGSEEITWFPDVTPRKGREWSEMEVPIDYGDFSGLLGLHR